MPPLTKPCPNSDETSRRTRAQDCCGYHPRIITSISFHIKELWLSHFLNLGIGKFKKAIRHLKRYKFEQKIINKRGIYSGRIKTCYLRHHHWHCLQCAWFVDNSERNFGSGSVRFTGDCRFSSSLCHSILENQKERRHHECF